MQVLLLDSAPLARPAAVVRHRCDVADAENREVSDVIDFENNGNTYSQVELTVETADVELFMLITAVESESHYYKILCWTMLEYKEKYKDDFKRIAQSIKD